MRDVRMTVREVVGSAVSGIEADRDVVFSVRGGQVLVTLTADQAQALGHTSGAGQYLYGSETEVDLSIGQELLIFLNSTPVHGLYNGIYAYQFQLFPAQEQTFAWLEDPASNTARALGQSALLLTAPTADIVNAVARDLGDRAGPPPVPGTIKEPPDVAVNLGPPASDQTEPDDS